MFIRTASDLGALIRGTRQKLGLDQISLARKAGTSRKWLVEVENGKPRAEIGLILQTLKALGVTLTADEPRGETRTGRAKPATASIDINQIINSLKGR